MTQLITAAKLAELFRTYYETATEHQKAEEQQAELANRAGHLIRARHHSKAAASFYRLAALCDKEALMWEEAEDSRKACAPASPVLKEMMAEALMEAEGVDQELQ